MLLPNSHFMESSDNPNFFFFGNRESSCIRNCNAAEACCPGALFWSEALIPPPAGSSTCWQFRAESLPKVPEARCTCPAQSYSPCLLGSSSHPKTSQYRVLTPLTFNTDGKPKGTSRVPINACWWHNPLLRLHWLITGERIISQQTLLIVPLQCLLLPTICCNYLVSIAVLFHRTKKWEVERGKLCLFPMINPKGMEWAGKTWTECFQNVSIWAHPGVWSSLHVDQEM